MRRTLLLALGLWLAAGPALAHAMTMAARVHLVAGGPVTVTLNDPLGTPVPGAAVRLQPGGPLAPGADPGTYTGTPPLPARGQVRLEVTYAGDRWGALLELQDGALVRPAGGALLLAPQESALAHGGWIWLLAPALLVVAAAAWLLGGRRGAAAPAVSQPPRRQPGSSRQIGPGRGE